MGGAAGLGRDGEELALAEVRGRVDLPHARLAHPLPLAVRELARVAVLVGHVHDERGRRVRLGVHALPGRKEGALGLG